MILPQPCDEPKAEAEQIKAPLAAFRRANLELELNQDKILITASQVKAILRFCAPDQAATPTSGLPESRWGGGCGRSGKAGA